MFTLEEGLRGPVPSFEVLNAGHSFLGVTDHLTEEIGKACPAELRGARAIEVSVIDSFAIGGGAELLRGSLRR